MEEVSFYGLELDAHDPDEVARFWAGVLGWRAVAQAGGGVEVAPDDDPAFRILVRLRPEARKSRGADHP